MLDGRDIGTVIFPDAPVKLFVTASLDARARRRWLELRAKGVAADLAGVQADMLARDTRDAPNMRMAADAVLLDTTDTGCRRGVRPGDAGSAGTPCVGAEQSDQTIQYQPLASLTRRPSVASLSRIIH